MHFMDNKFTMLFISIWILLFGAFFIILYLFHDRNTFLNKLGNVIIELSFIKRTKLILLSYGLLALFIGLIGMLVFLIT